MRHTSRSLSRDSLIRFLPWLSGLVLLAGVVAFVVVHASASASSDASTTTTSRKAGDSSTPNTNTAVALDPRVRQVAGRFILTAVRRQHLDEAWKITGPAIRQNLTYKQWLTGNIPVIPYTAPIGVAPLHVVSSQPREALLEVVLVPKHGSGARPQDFFIGLIKIKRKGREQWVVNYWLPRAAPAVPLRPSG
jgi:hypothetical protein